ncbi:MAG: hypothetical protein IT176_00155 [Acidobacteria bacterium]|nr:hypothetical protein [Acidobacteriota bacterium]
MNARSVVSACARRTCATAGLALLCAAATVACGGGAPVPSDVEPFAGTWRGPLEDIQSSLGVMEIHLAERSGSLQGTWSVALAGGGTLSGEIAEEGAGGIPATRQFRGGCTSGRNGFVWLRISGETLGVQFLFMDCQGLSYGAGRLNRISF